MGSELRTTLNSPPSLMTSMLIVHGAPAGRCRQRTKQQYEGNQSARALNFAGGCVGVGGAKHSRAREWESRPTQSDALCRSGVIRDLRSRKLSRRRKVYGVLAIPSDGARDCFLKRPDRLPAEKVKSFVGRQVQSARFVKSASQAAILPGAGPMFEDFLDEIRDRSIGRKIGSEIEGGAEGVERCELRVDRSRMDRRT